MIDQAEKTAGSNNSSSTDENTSDSEELSDDYQKIEGQKVDPTSKMLMSNIALFAATLAAPILIKQCGAAPSVWIYAGSAAVYLANEIGIFTNFKNASDAEMAAYLGRGDEDKQIDSLESAANNTDKAVKAAKRRATVAKIAAAGFSAATAMALVENYTSWVSAGGCGPQGGDASVTPKKDIHGLKLYTHSAQENIDPQLLVMNSDNFDFMVSYEEQIDFIEGKNQSISIDDYNKRREQSASALNSLPDFKQAFITATEFALAAVSSNAHAEDDDKKSGGTVNWSGSGVKTIVGFLGAAAGVVAMNTKAIAGSKMVKNPLTRAALFGGMGVFAIGAAKEAQDASDKLQQRSNEYRRLADTLRNQVGQNVVGTGASVAQTVSGASSATDAGDAHSANDNICTTGSSTTSLSADPDCACASDDSCKKSNMPSLSAMPEFGGKSLLSDTLKSLKSAGDNVYAGRLEGANTDANSLSSNAARINKLRDALVKKINKDNLAAGGKGNYDLDKLQDKFNDQLLNKVNDSFKGLSESEQSKLASFAPALSDEEVVTEESTNKEVAKETAAVGGTGAIASGSKKSKSNQGSSWDFDFGEDDKSAEGTSEQAALAQAMAQEDENYVIEGDINDDRNKNIFKIITGRYLKSAYPVIFEEQ